ncbi:hypothetical protein [Euzebya sp.]|uniref:hypothetical protein n=1 Tax=Euzebya sp. TaxID=1971409 RepID=UPI003511B5AC
MATSTTSKQVLVRLTPEEHVALQRFASITNTSANDVVRRALRDFLAGPGRREEFDQLVSDAKDQYRAALDRLADE